VVASRLLLSLPLAGLLVLTPLGPAAAPRAAGPAWLPSVALEDQEGRLLHLDALRGRVVVVVYGRREGAEDHVRWGRQLDAWLRARGIYRPDDAPAGRPVQILALAQMGGIPRALRPVLQAVLRQRVAPAHSLWLDWDDAMSAHFGAHARLSTVVVADPGGRVRLVVTHRPEGAAWEAVVDLLDRLR
jgi:hypothetical protein